jgi:hypothetical protein
MTINRLLLLAVLTTALSVAGVAVAVAGQELVGGHVPGGGGSSAGGSARLVGSIPASAAGRSAGGSFILTAGFGAAAQVWSDQASATDAAAGGTGGMVSALAARPAGNGAQITFTLSADAEVAVTILNIAGRPVRRLCTAKPCEPGTSTLIWNAQADNGLNVPAGMYLVSMTATSPNGQSSRALTTLNLRR